MWTWKQRMLCLALTVFPLGEIQVHPNPARIKRPASSDLKRKSPRRAGYDASSLEMFTNIHWGTIKILMGLLDSVQDSLSWVCSCLPNGEISELDACYVRTGRELLERLNEDHSKLEREVTVLKGELFATRENLVSLSRENVGLKQKLSSSKEAGLILEQDRKQLQALLEDKHRLQEDNYRLEREIGALQELLEYAAEHVLDRMSCQAADEDIRSDGLEQHSEQDLTDMEYLEDPAADPPRVI
ncbi:hypothetical protein BSKO_04188 [Bryopsis sp. KO-2023]|nr:hypothetical protein BSKO_04188 [Bryopsis sp. KO-2023]